MSAKGTKEPSLHDWLALGELDVALAPEKRQDCRNDEIRRLPLLLRMLSASQPLSSIPAIEGQDAPQQQEKVDPLVDTVVSRLEDVAATHSAAEGVDALTSFHAPSICRKISRVAPLKREKQKRIWKTDDLASVAASPVDNGPRKKRKQLETAAAEAHSGDEIIQATQEDDDDGVVTDDDRMMIDDENVKDSPSTNDPMQGVAEDSQESTATRSLSEIASLVVASLQPITQNEEGTFSNLSLSVGDSLLSEPESRLDASGCAGAVGGCDYGATLSALMHHSPVLRHSHVANALCRSAAPQAAVLIGRMGANCPSAVPCLLRGCIDAYTSALESPRIHLSIINTAKTGVRSISSLSLRESCRARSTLQQSNVMVDVQLELAIRQDPVALACVLNENLRHCAVEAKELTGTTKLATSGEALSYQSPRRMRTYEPLDSESQRIRAVSLELLLQDNPSLFQSSCECLLNALTEPHISGRTLLLLRAYSFLVLFGGKDAAALTPDLIAKATRMLVALQENVLGAKRDENEKVAPKSVKDPCFRLLVCACLATHARVSAEDDLSYLEPLFNGQSLSLRSDVFLSRVAGLLKDENGGARLCSLILETLADDPKCIVSESLAVAFQKTCEKASAAFDLRTVILRGTADDAAMQGLSALLQSVELDGCNKRADEFVCSILQDEVKCDRVVTSEHVYDLIKAAVLAVSKEGGTKVPRVLPVQLQSLALKMDWSKDGARVAQPSLERQFLFQLVYALCFLDQEPMSPFAIDPREFPLKETYERSKVLTKDNHDLSHIASATQQLFEKLTPEVLTFAELTDVNKQEYDISSGTPLSIQQARRALCEKISTSIRECKRDVSIDPSGCAVERIFVLASRQLTISEADTEAVRALLAFPHEPLPFLTYTGLCRDPLSIFKAPLSVWRCRGLRRITLAIMSRLLVANENMINKASPTEEAASELIASRDAIIVRCLIMASITDQNEPSKCPVVIAMVRSIIARQTGLVAMLVKQGQNNALVDWIVENVPESLHDAQALSNLLSERSSLLAAERLVTADASLRIAIAHGQRDETAAKALAYAALTRLVSSFFLVVGPVGVPVNAIGAIGEDGTDVTQICRVATFRMLSALQNVSGSREGLRSECSIAVQKLAGLCKGETIMNGVAGSVAKLRKKLLKEIYVAVVRAANAMGSGPV